MIPAATRSRSIPTAGHAAAWGVLIAGCLEVLLLAADVTRQGARPGLRWPRLDEELAPFLKKFGPATLGSAGTQVALFADTIIASFLTTGALSALYYADRLNQLPIGVIGIAVGTVLLPEMAKRLAAGDEAGAHHSQNRAVELTLLLSVPCVVAFLLVPELIMRALFTRGAFTTADAQAAAATLAAYALGLLPFVLLRNASITFLARGDTITPVKALAVSVVVNVALKVALMGPLAQVGLALATAVGAWVNLSLLVSFAARQRRACDLAAGDCRDRAGSGALAGAGTDRGAVLALDEAALRGDACILGRTRRLRLHRHGAGAVRARMERTVPPPDCGGSRLERDEMSLNRLLLPFVLAEAGTQLLAEFSAPGFPLSRE